MFATTTGIQACSKLECPWQNSPLSKFCCQCFPIKDKNVKEELDEFQPFYSNGPKAFIVSVIILFKKLGGEWTPHKVELAVWTHSVMNEFKAETLLDMPSRHAAAPQAAATATAVTTSAASSNGTDQVKIIII